MAIGNNQTSLTSSGFGLELKDIDLAELDDNTKSILVEGFYASGGAILIRNQQHLTPKQLSLIHI